MIDALKKRCMSEQTWEAVRQALIDQFSDIRTVMTLAAQLRLDLETVSTSGDCGPWTADVKVTYDDAPAMVKIDIVLTADDYKVEAKWHAPAFREHFLKTNLRDPRAATALVRAVQALLTELARLVDEHLEALEQDPDYLEARQLVDAIAVSRSLDTE
uniref:Uncharacterized protein n=1 Tax=Thermorudis peleae TaxID=1382356 RepID=A0A831X8C8_9BACT